MMEHLFAECSVKAIFFVMTAALVLFALRVKVASVKHLVWSGVVALMLLLPLWTAWGPRTSVGLLPQLAHNIANQAKATPGSSSSEVPSSTHVNPVLPILLIAYLLGLCPLLFRLAIGTVRVRRLVRDAVVHEGLHTSPFCVVPVTVGFFHPVVIFPEQWRQWPRTQLDAILIHESEHVRGRHPLALWLALLNRAVFWFHPVAWWLEHRLSALAEEACDNAVLARGCDRHTYSQYLLDMARVVRLSGARLSGTGLTMPGSSLAQRIKRINEGRPVPYISRTKMAFAYSVSAMFCCTIAAGKLDHAQSPLFHRQTMIQNESSSAAHDGKKILLADLKIEGNVRDPDQVRDRVLKTWQKREYDNTKELTEEASERIRADFQERGYFQTVVQPVSSHPLELDVANQRVLVIASVTEGDQFRLKTITFQNAAPDHALTIPMAVLRGQFHLRDGDLFNTTEIGSGLDRLRKLYLTHGYPDTIPMPDTEIDNASHRIDLTLRITEGQHAP
jgi:beta-lactamase regulating signal transducer with metallopeptidase domain